MGNGDSFLCIFLPSVHDRFFIKWKQIFLLHVLLLAFCHFPRYVRFIALITFLLFLPGRGQAPQQGLVPGKVISFWNGFFYPLFGVEHHLDKDFDVLCTKTPEKFKWVAAKGCKYFSRLALV